MRWWDVADALHTTEPYAGRGDRVARLVVLPLVALFAVVLLAFYVMFHAVHVDGDSMLPTLRPHDMLLYTRGYAGPVRNEIVIVKLGPNFGSDEIVKRVIGVPGDVVEVKEDVAYVNGKREDTSGRIIVADASVTLAPYTVPPGRVFLMGDNRPVSMDSRFIGAVPITEVKGTVVAIYAPITRARLIK